MKKVLLFLMIFVIIPAYPQGKENTADAKPDSVVAESVSQTQNSNIDSVNISQIVQAQIAAARKEETEKKSQPVVNIQAKKVEKAKNSWTNIFVELRKNIPLSNDNFMKAVILIAFSFMAFIVVFLRRLKNKLHKPSKKEKSSDSLKKNISILREEKPLKIKYKKKLKLIRSKLSKNYSMNPTSESLTRTARELNIAKGEVLLAARIKAHEYNNKQTVKSKRSK